MRNQKSITKWLYLAESSKIIFRCSRVHLEDCERLLGVLLSSTKHEQHFVSVM